MHPVLVEFSLSAEEGVLRGCAFARGSERQRVHRGRCYIHSDLHALSDWIVSPIILLLFLADAGHPRRVERKILPASCPLQTAVKAFQRRPFCKLASVHAGAARFPARPQASARRASGQTPWVRGFAGARRREPG